MQGLLLRVNEFKIEPHGDHCACMIDFLRLTGLLQEVEEIPGQSWIEVKKKVCAFSARNVVRSELE